MKAAVVAAGLFVSSTRFDGSVLFLAILGIPSSAIMGVIVAFIIRVIAKDRIRVFNRAAIGAALMFALGIIAYTGGVSGWSLDDVSTWMVASLFYIDFGIAIGAVAGIMAGRNKATELQ